MLARSLFALRAFVPQMHDVAGAHDPAVDDQEALVGERGRGALEGVLGELDPHPPAERRRPGDRVRDHAVEIGQP